MTNPVVAQVLDGMNSVVERYDAEIESLRTQLVDATARAERAENKACEQVALRQDIVNETIRTTRAQIAAAEERARLAEEAAARDREKREQMAVMLVDAEQRAERAERDAVVVRDGHWDAVIAERDEARAQLAEAERRLAVADTIAANRLEALERAESLCTERGEQVATLFGQLRDMQARAEQAEARVLSGECVDTTIRLLEWARDVCDLDSANAALVEIATKYGLIKYPADGGSDG